MTTRQAALRNPDSVYFRNVEAIIRRAMVDQERAVSNRRKVMIPFKVSAASVAEYERIFGWKIVVENHGTRCALSQHVAGLAYCMSLRNMLSMGSDGEEIIALDADLPLVVAKGAAYVKVVRTSMSNRLVTGYALEEMQLARLAAGANGPTKTAAQAVLAELRAGGGGRVFLHPTDPTISGDAVVVDHTRTSISLKQAVACATAWGASSVRGVCFFQVEMLTVREGALSSFPGRYYVDEYKDTITYVPEEDPETSFSHCWSALRSFFVNHECVYEGKTWVVEKHLGERGIFHYAARRADEEWMFPTELGASYYTDDLQEWVELEYPTRGGVASGSTAVYWRREKVRLLKSLYDKTMAVMMAAEPKRLTRDGILNVMRAFNNTVVIAGDTVKKPFRVYVGELEKAAVPMLAQVVHRRTAASTECSHAMTMLRRRYNVANECVLALLWDVCCASAEYMKELSITAAIGAESKELHELVSGGVNMAVIAKEVPTSITVKQVAGTGTTRDCGATLPGFPGDKPAFLESLLKRARQFSLDGTFCFNSNGARKESMSESGTVLSGTESSSEDCVLPVVELEEFIPHTDAQREGIAARLHDKLVAEQDAAVFVRPPKMTTSYESVQEVPVSQVITPKFGTAEMQDDYDDGFVGVSMSDQEIVPYVAAVSDTALVRDAHMSLNVSKFEAASAKQVRRAKCRAGAAGVLPRTQIGLLAATGKRNTDVPVNRANVNFNVEPAKAVEKIRAVCFRENWKEILERELNAGLWQPCVEDLNVYVGKVDTHKAELMLREFFNTADVDMKRWLIMTKGKSKPPLDPGADGKVPLPQTIMYNESKGMNAMYSSIMSRFHDVVDMMTTANVKFNDRASPADHEVWFNTLQPVRATAKNVYRYQGDSYNFDRSQELMSHATELCFYRAHGLDEATLTLWKTTMGVKQAVSAMHGLLLYIALQGLSGIFKTLFRNGVVTWASVVDAANLDRNSLISLDIKGDDYTIETTVPVDTERAVRTLAWRYNFSAKLWGCDYLYFCSKYWLYVDGWWYWVADPERKFESLCAAVSVDNTGDDKMSEKWVSLRDDLRHYNNGVVMEELGNAVLASNPRRTRPPMMLIGGLAQLAESKDDFFSFYGPAEFLGL